MQPARATGRPHGETPSKGAVKREGAKSTQGQSVLATRNPTLLYVLVVSSLLRLADRTPMGP